MTLPDSGPGRNGMLRQRVKPLGQQQFSRRRENFLALGGRGLQLREAGNAKLDVHFLVIVPNVSRVLT